VFLRQVWLWNFRNYKEIALSFGARITVLQAKNSQGKTNLLEAIYYLSSLSSPRCSRPQEMIRHGTPGFSIKGRVEDRLSQRELAIYLGEDARTLWIGGKKISHPGRYWGKLPTVMFSPDDLSLVGGADELRRRFLDRCAALEDRGHLEELAQLRKVLAQRNRALRSGDKRQLRPWDEQLSCLWEKIYRSRTKIVDKMNRDLPSLLDSLGSEKEAMVRYQPILAEKVAFPPPDLVECLGRSWHQEMRTGFSLYGPHRDEILMELNGYDARRFSSRGEKRLLSLSLRLFELLHLEQVGGESPVILLDDLFSELDEERRGKVASTLLAGGQAMVTCTDLGVVQALLPGAEVFRIQEGRAERIGTGPIELIPGSGRAAQREER